MANPLPDLDALEAANVPVGAEHPGRDAAGETILGMRVAAYRETHPEHGDKYGHRYSEHWSTPSTRDPRVKVERLFTEADLREQVKRAKLEGMREAAEIAERHYVGKVHGACGYVARDIAAAIREAMESRDG